MPNAVIVDVADAVVTALNAASLSQAFTAARKVVPKYEVADLSTLRVTVVPRARESAKVGRGLLEDFHVIDVAVQKQITPETTTDADGLLYLCQQIADLFLGERLATYATAVCVAAETDPVWDEEHAVALRVFTGTVRLRYQVVRTG